MRRSGAAPFLSLSRAESCTFGMQMETQRTSFPRPHPDGCAVSLKGVKRPASPFPARPPTPAITAFVSLPSFPVPAITCRGARQWLACLFIYFAWERRANTAPRESTAEALRGSGRRSAAKAKGTRRGSQTEGVAQQQGNIKAALITAPTRPANWRSGASLPAQPL